MSETNPLDPDIFSDSITEHIKTSGGLLSLSSIEVYELTKQANEKIYLESMEYDRFFDYWMEQCR